MNDYGMVLQQDLADRCTAVSSGLSQAVPVEAMECFREGLQHFQAGNPGAALSAFSRSVLQAPEFGEAHIFLGLANALTSNIYPAFDHLERAVELQPDSFAAHFTLGARERNGIARPWFNKPWFNKSWFPSSWLNKPRLTKQLPAIVVGGSGLVAAVIALIVHTR